jgi:uncharacterized Zn finger protein
MTTAWFTHQEVRRLAGERSYERGVGYVDYVQSLGELPDGVVATVHGTSAYRVRLRDDGGLVGECSCPYGQDGNFCKHCVAVSLHLLTAVPAQPDRRGAKRKSRQVDVHKYLQSLTADELVQIIWDHAQEDAVLFQRLQLAAVTSSVVPDLGLLRTQVEQLHTEWLAYEDTDAYATTAQSVLDALERLTARHAATVQPLLRRAVEVIGAAAGISEDEHGAIIEVADAAWDRYLAACRLAPPDPAELARWLVTFQLEGPDWPEVSLDDIADLLGGTGLEAYRVALDEAGSRHRRHWRYRSLREEFVAVSGDTDALIECLAEDLSAAHQWVRIATLLRDEGRVDEAVAWLERGRSDGKHLGHGGGPLTDLLCELYQASGRHREILTLREERFADQFGETEYQQLREAAERVGRWLPARKQAHTLLRKKAQTNAYYAADILARILLAEDEADAAWRVVRQHRCEERTLLAVTERRADTHPADAIKIYQPHVERCVDQRNNYGYQQAAAFLLKLRPLVERVGGDFPAYLEEVRERHRRKRNFIAELDRKGLR